MYDAGIADLASRATGAFQGSDAELEDELARIRRDMRSRPDTYASMVRRFTRASLRTRAGGAPYPTAEETTESYRLVWEYLLLRPVLPEEAGAATADRALVALTTIRSEASVPALAEAFHKDADQTRGQDLAMQRSVLITLQCIPSKRALDAILDCAAATERQLAKIASMPDGLDRMNASLYRWRPLEEAARIGAPGTDKRWTAVIDAYRPKDADPLKARVMALARTAKRG